MSSLAAIADMLGNRVQKNARHLGKWARRAEVTCWRVYDRDIPEVPITIDRYEGALVVNDYREFDRPDADHRITTKLDIAEFLWARTGALKAHATQVDPTEKWWFGLDDAQLAEVYPHEDWILARSLVGDIPGPGQYETDLFAGVRDLAISGGDE